MTCERMKKCANGDYCNYHVGFLVSGCMNFKEKKPLTNEEWFNGLSTETKARIMHLVYMAGYRDGHYGAETIPLQDIMKWLKQPHKEESEK